MSGELLKCQACFFFLPSSFSSSLLCQCRSKKTLHVGNVLGECAWPLPNLSARLVIQNGKNQIPYLATFIQHWLHYRYTTASSSQIKILALQSAEITEGIQTTDVCRNKYYVSFCPLHQKSKKAQDIFWKAFKCCLLDPQLSRQDG